MSRYRVVFLGGWGRSGSTLLGNVLNEIDDFVHVGELTYVWETGWLANRSCGCGRPFKECEFWSRVVARAYGGFSVDDARSSIALRDEVTGNRHVARSLVNPWADASRLARYASVVDKLYAAISEESGNRVIVDSSKLPIQLYVLLSIEGIDVRVVHLVRDPRATAFSWQREVHREDSGPKASMRMERFGVVASAQRWSKCNFLTGRLGAQAQAYMRLRYEDMMRDPEGAIRTVCQFAGVDATNPFDVSGAIHMTGNHTAWGNPSRVRTGETRLRIDNHWVENMSRSSRAAVSALTLPLLLKYGYKPWTPFR